MTAIAWVKHLTVLFCDSCNYLRSYVCMYDFMTLRIRKNLFKSFETVVFYVFTHGYSEASVTQLGTYLQTYKNKNSFRKGM